MANRLGRKITFIYHSQKMVDEKVACMLRSDQNNEIRFFNLANTDIPIELLKEVTSKLSNWQSVLLDTRYMDHSISDPERQFLLMEDSFKILFLKNNSWLIGTPLVMENDKVFRFQQVSDVTVWLNAKKISILKTLSDQSIEVPSTL